MTRRLRLDQVRQFFPEVETDIVISRLTMAAGRCLRTHRPKRSSADIESQGLANWTRTLSRRDGCTPGSSRAGTSIGSQPLLQGFQGVDGQPKGSHVGEVTIELAPATEPDSSPARRSSSRWRELVGRHRRRRRARLLAAESAAGGNAIDLELVGDDIDELRQRDRGHQVEALGEFDRGDRHGDSNIEGKRELELDILPEAEGPRPAPRGRRPPGASRLLRRGGAAAPARQTRGEGLRPLSPRRTPLHRRPPEHEDPHPRRCRGPLFRGRHRQLRPHLRHHPAHRPTARHPHHRRRGQTTDANANEIVAALTRGDEEEGLPGPLGRQPRRLVPRVARTRTRARTGTRRPRPDEGETPRRRLQLPGRTARPGPLRSAR